MNTKAIFMLVAICTIALSACSSAPPKPLKIVVSVPQELDFGRYMGDAVQMAFDETGGKIGDVPLELTMFDGGVSENKELIAINSLKDDPQFVLYLGAYTSGFAREVIPLTNQLRIPVVSLSATWPGLTKAGYGVGEPGLYYPIGERTFFRVVPADDLQGKVAAEFIQDQGYQSIYIINADDVYADGLTNLLLANAESMGIPIVGQSHYDPDKVTEADIQTILTAVEAAKPDAIYLSIVFREKSIDILNALKSANPDLPIIGSDALVGSNMGAESQGLHSVYATVFKIAPDQTPELTAFAKKFQDKYNAAPTEYVITSYEATKVALDAISRAGSAPTRTTVLKALHETKDYKGVMGTWSFDDSGDTSYDTFSLVTLENGVWVPFHNVSN